MTEGGVRRFDDGRAPEGAAPSAGMTGDVAPDVVVLGLGNVLIGDDALGPYAVRTFAARYDVDDRVAVHDVGTPGLDLAPHLMEARAAIIVDVVRAPGEPGTMRLYRRDQLFRSGPGPRVSPHDPGLKETLLLLELQGMAPEELLLVGVVPERVRTGLGLTPAVRCAVPAVLVAIAEELARLGHPVRLRARAAEADLWWESARGSRRAPSVPPAV